MNDNETIIKNSLLYVSDLCYQNNLNWEMRNRGVIISDEPNSNLLKITFKSRTIEIKVNGKIKVIKLDAPETSQEIFDRFTKKLLTSLQLMTDDRTVSSLKENYERSKGVKDFKTKLLYHFLKITNNKQTHFSSTQDDRYLDLLKKDSGCMRFFFKDKDVEYRPFVRTPLGITESELDQMVEDLEYTFADNKKYYSDWEIREVDLENKKVAEAFNDVLAAIRQFDKSVENKKLKHNFTEATYI